VGDDVGESCEVGVDVDGAAVFVGRGVRVAFGVLVMVGEALGVRVG
jgi:hypothetical protein